MMEMVVRLMETAETAMETDGDGSGGTFPSIRVPEQRILSPKICHRRRQSYGILSGKLPISLGFSILRLLIGEAAASGGDQGGGRGQGQGRAPLLCGQPLAPSGSRSIFGTLPGKVRLLELVSSNSENISCVAFLKHKNSRK
jgi:hypothetical protein